MRHDVLIICEDSNQEKAETLSRYLRLYGVRILIRTVLSSDTRSAFLVVEFANKGEALKAPIKSWSNKQDLVFRYRKRLIVFMKESATQGAASLSVEESVEFAIWKENGKEVAKVIRALIQHRHPFFSYWPWVWAILLLLLLAVILLALKFY